MNISKRIHVYITQVSVATRLRCGGIFSGYFIANLLLSVQVTEDEEHFCIDRGPLRGSSSPLRHFEPARVKPN